ncbi:MAG TPA: hypothetical protein VJZ25_03455 [Gemmatimonadaceae bacterium]|nr:hypothetical protein [Gemmatimonadaceae bacterium]
MSTVPIRVKVVSAGPKPGDRVRVRGLDGEWEYVRRNACATYLRRVATHTVTLTDRYGEERTFEAATARTEAFAASLGLEVA